MQKLSAGKFHFEPPSSFTSFDHLVGEGEECRWHSEAERVRCLEIKHQIVLDWRLHWQGGRPLALENAIDIGGRTPNNIGGVGSIGHQRAFRDELPKTIDRRKPMSLRQMP